MRFSSFWRYFICLQAVIFFSVFAKSVQAQTQTEYQPQTIATLDWTVAETLIALGEPPQVVGDAKSYPVWVVDPILPEKTVDLGIRMQPNPEQILRLKPPIFFINTDFYATQSERLQQFGKVEIVSFYQEGNAWQNVLKATEQIAHLIRKPEAGQALVAQFSQKIAEIRPLVAPFTTRPVALVQFIDSRHLRLYGKNSLFGEVLLQMGFENAWQGTTNIWGFETIDVTQLANLPVNTLLVVVKPYPNNIATSLQYNSLWQTLPLAQDPLILPAVWTFGGIPSAQRFAEILANALQTGGEKW